MKLLDASSLKLYSTPKYVLYNVLFCLYLDVLKFGHIQLTKMFKMSKSSGSTFTKILLNFFIWK